MVYVYILQQLMIYNCIKYPLSELVYTFYNNSRVSLNLLYITIDECLLLSY